MFTTAAYVFDREGLILRDADAVHLNQLNFSFALVKDGCVNGEHWINIDAYKAFIARHPHILPVVSVGGWAADGFSQAAATPQGRERFVQTTLDLMQAHGFLGVDIDWEYPGSDEAGIAASPQDRENFTLLMRALREGLDALTAQDGKPRLLATALGAKRELVELIDNAAVGQIVDQVNLMSYDIQTRSTISHMTPLYSADPRYINSAHSSVGDYTAAGIPKEKIMVGCAYYARLFEAEQGAPQLFAPSVIAGFDTINYRRLMAEEGWTHGYDETACAAYSVKGSRFATHDAPDSLAAKGAYVRQNGLMGLMCWEYGGDRDGELLQAMYESLQP